MTLHKAERQYNERVEDIRVLCLEIRNLRHKNALLQNSCGILQDMRYSFFHFHVPQIIRNVCLR
jgi:FtsZ-binding cell division protein ZapB